MSVAENIYNAINTSIKNGKLIALPGDYPYSEFSVQAIQFEIIDEKIVFELCVETIDDKKSILCSVLSRPSDDFKCNSFFRLSDSEITSKQVLEVFGLQDYTFKITYCEGPKENYMSTPVHSIPPSQFELYVPKN